MCPNQQAKNMPLIYLQKILKLRYFLRTSDKKNFTQQGRNDGHFGLVWIFARAES